MVRLRCSVERAEQPREWPSKLPHLHLPQHDPFRPPPLHPFQVEVGPLLSFSDPALESAFLASLHKRRLRMDCLYLSTIAGDNLLLMLLRLVPRAEWQLACPLLLDALAALLLLLCWYLAGSAAFIRHRPWLIGSMLVLHAVVSALQQGQACPSRANTQCR